MIYKNGNVNHITDIKVTTSTVSFFLKCIRIAGLLPKGSSEYKRSCRL